MRNRTQKILFFWLLLETVACTPITLQYRAYQKINNSKPTKAKLLIGKLFINPYKQVMANGLMAQYILAFDTGSFAPDSLRKYADAALAMYKIRNKKYDKYLPATKTDSVTLVKYISQADSLGFAIAIKRNTPEAFENYMLNYSGTPYYKRAQLLRDSLRFDIALATNTSKALYSFATNYPYARQSIKAMQIADSLQFSEECDTTNLPSLIRFVKHFTKNRFRNKALVGLYYMLCANDKPSSYSAFIEYAKSTPYEEWAKQRLFYLNQPTEANNIVPIPSGVRIRSKHTHNQLLLNNIHPDSGECPEVAYNLLVYQEKGLYGARNFDGKVKIPFAFDDIEIFENGMALVELKGLYGLYHLSGLQVLPCINQSVEPLGNSLYKVQNGGIYSIVNAHGKTVLNNIGPTVSVSQGFVIIKNNNKNAVIHTSQLFGSASLGSINLSYDIDEVNTAPNAHALLRKGNLWALSDSIGNLLLPFKYNNLTFAQNFVIAEADKKLLVFNLKTKAFLPTNPCSELKYIKPFFIGKFEGKWGIMAEDGKITHPFIYDSAVALSASITLLKTQNKLFVAFANKHFAEYSEYSKFRLLTTKAFGIATRNSEFLITEKSDGNKGLISSMGKPILPPIYKSIFLVARNLIVAEVDKKVMIFDTLGKPLFTQKFDAAGNAFANYLNVMRNQKFYLANYKTGTISNIGFDASLVPVNPDETLFSTINNGHYGIVDFLGKTIIPFKFDKIEMLNSDTFLVGINGKYNLYSVSKSDTIGLKGTITQIYTDGFLISSGNKQGFIGVNGQQIVPPIHQRIIRLGGQVYLGITNNQVNYYNHMGELLSTLFAERNQMQLLDCFEAQSE